MLTTVRIAGLAAGFLFCAGAASAGGFDSETVTQDANLADFKSVYVAPVELDLKADGGGYGSSRERPVSADDAAKKAADFHADLVRAFDDFSRASAPGAGVLTIAATLTELKSSRPTMADYDRNAGLSASSIYAGGASVEFDFSEAGAVLAEVSDEYETSLSDGRSRIGLWDDADRAFSSWARRVADFVREH